MTTPHAGPSGTNSGGSSPVGFRRLTRRRDGRVVAGVCGGLGRYTDVDPVVYRVLVAVLAVFGGVGLLFYLLAWLFLPEDDETASPVQALLHRTDAHGNPVSSRTGSATTVLLAGLTVLALIVVVAGRGTLFFLVIGAAGGGLLIWHLTGRGRTPSASGGGYPPPEPPAQPPFAPHGPWPEGGPGPAGGPVTERGGAEFTAESDPTRAMPTAAMPTTGTTPWTKPRRERSGLGRIVIGIAFLGLAGALVLDRLTGITLTAPELVAGLLAVIGVGLLVGSLVGRARWLIIPGVVLALLLGGLTAQRHLDGPPWFGTGNHVWTPATVAEVGNSYSYGSGASTLDLSQVDFSGSGHDVSVQAAAGSIRVLVPADTDATVDGHVVLGNLVVFGRTENGVRRWAHVSDDGVDGPGGGTLHLDLGVGVGDVKVDRAAA